MNTVMLSSSYVQSGWRLSNTLSAELYIDMSWNW